MNVLAVVAHSDDEVLGCGGTLARHAGSGDEVTVLCLCDRGLRSMFARACAQLGVKWLEPRGLPDQRFDTLALTEIADMIRVSADSLHPHDRLDVVYLHSPDDLNLDHVVAARATLTAFRPAGRPMPTLLAFETISSSEWSPAPFAANWYVELSDELLARKRAALACYPGEMRPQPHPRNFVGVGDRARARGAEAGVRCAEAFRLLRHTCSTESDRRVAHLSDD